jgi:Fe2+ transport system protein FeoA
MPSISLALRSDGARLSSLRAGARGVVVGICADRPAGASRLAALGVTAGAHITVLQTFPVLIFECDQTEVAVENAVGHEILVTIDRT